MDQQDSFKDIFNPISAISFYSSLDGMFIGFGATSKLSKWGFSKGFRRMGLFRLLLMVAQNVGAERYKNTPKKKKGVLYSAKSMSLYAAVQNDKEYLDVFTLMGFEVVGGRVDLDRCLPAALNVTEVKSMYPKNGNQYQLSHVLVKLSGKQLLVSSQDERDEPPSSIEFLSGNIGKRKGDQCCNKGCNLKENVIAEIGLKISSNESC